MSLPREILLKDILSQPTAPFRESYVISRIQQELEQTSVPYFQDKIGNMIIGVSSQREYLKLIQQKDPEPVRFFMAHMDHPGFHGVKWRSNRELDIQWHGGSPTEALSGARVWLTDPWGWKAEGKLASPKLLASKKALNKARVLIHPSEYLGPADQIFGGFCFQAPYWQEGELLYTKAADDLVGSFVIVSMAIEIWEKKKRKKKQERTQPPFIGLLTRAEEVGFIGAMGHFELGWLLKAQREIICISLESSRTLPGAEIGKGPIIRLGDRFTVFDPGLLYLSSNLAEKTLPNRHQKRIMDGGTCEATVSTAFGFRSMGLSIPLGNYHNQCLEGGSYSGSFSGPAPEFVSLRDIENLHKFCLALMKPHLPWSKPWDVKRKNLKKNYRKYQLMLQTGL